MREILEVDAGPTSVGGNRGRLRTRSPAPSFQDLSAFYGLTSVTFRLRYS
jgi:hypothetical protein